MNENGQEFVIEAQYLLARCILHELDHLDGILFTDQIVDVPDDFEPEDHDEEFLISLNLVLAEV